MTMSALAEPRHPVPRGRAAADGGGADGGAGPDGAQEYARRLMSRLAALGLRTSGPWESPAPPDPPSPMAVSAQCVQVEPYVGRTVWLLPPPGDPAGDRDAGLYWHWQRPRRNRRGHPIARWFQPFCPAADPEKAATAISEAIFADVRRRRRR
ncbi:hypothetical protein [Actinomadura opuntiae]|uniref:hypothetical protein n=1 Tax=Actinomadura sp. OS1-43 TaxID=604315 RepID=UPI00255B361A|nr:hypothetical protein [Actinomadura sp. OS1-43]MDL4815205.1 hypothetical protein [Actinomadura sp. OS1-43]